MAWPKSFQPESGECEEASWKVDSLVQNWDGLYAYAYPPTSLIRACLNKVRTENVEIVLIAPGWPNQE